VKPGDGRHLSRGPKREAKHVSNEDVWDVCPHCSSARSRLLPSLLLAQKADTIWMLVPAGRQFCEFAGCCVASHRSGPELYAAYGGVYIAERDMWALVAR